jgi:CubicO group peptidase (beta-lactamase class C family)
MNKPKNFLAKFLITLMLLGSGWPLFAQQEPAVETVLQPTPVEQLPADEEAPPGSQLNPADLEDWLDGYLSAALKPSKIAGAVVSVVQDGQLLFSKGYGYADVENKTPMDPARTLVRVGSTSKLFTWTAVMQQVEQGKLDLDADVNGYLDFAIPGYEGKPVTLNDVMTHRGGFEEGLKEVLVTDPAKYISTETYLKNHPRPRIFPAGAVPAYSNYGTALAGYIVERTSGEPFDDYIEKHILLPLGMQHSSFRQPLPESLRTDMSQGYTRDDQPPYAFEQITTAPAGSLSATANDMANFMIAQLQDGRFEDRQILQPATARLMHSPTFPPQDGFATLAHGFFSGSENGRAIIGHGGDTIVFHTDLNMLPDENVGIFVSFNSRGAGDAVYDLRDGLFADFMDRYFPEMDAEPTPAAIADAAAHAQELAGNYQSSRRIQTAFLKLFYLLHQTKVIANEDGTISLGSPEAGRFREIGPNLWRDVDSNHMLYVEEIDGRMTIADSRNPTDVLHAAPFTANASLNLFILLGSLTVLLVTLIAWPVGWCYRRYYGQNLQLSGSSKMAYRLSRFAALGALVYLGAWSTVLQPLLETRVEFYGPDLDGLLRALQFGAVIPVAGALIGLWNAELSLRSGRHWTAILGNLLLAAALIGMVWIAWTGSLISFNLEY